MPPEMQVLLWWSLDTKTWSNQGRKGRRPKPTNQTKMQRSEDKKGRWMQEIQPVGQCRRRPNWECRPPTREESTPKPANTTDQACDHRAQIAWEKPNKGRTQPKWEGRSKPSPSNRKREPSVKVKCRNNQSESNAECRRFKRHENTAKPKEDEEVNQEYDERSKKEPRKSRCKPIKPKEHPKVWKPKLPKPAKVPK